MSTQSLIVNCNVFNKIKLNPKIYVILPVHNRISKTKEFINCLKNQTYSRYHLILVDDGSSDGTSALVKKHLRNVTILLGNGNLWWAGALRIAYLHLSKAQVSDNDLVWIANDDITFESDYFDKLVNDEDLRMNTLVISPGRCLSSGFVERGFLIDWAKLEFFKLQKTIPPDAITTRGLCMYAKTFLSILPTPSKILPHYLSDLEYTMRAKRFGYDLRISKSTLINVDRTTTGMHEDRSKTFKEFLFNNFISKKSAFNYFYLGNFILLTCPWKYKIFTFLKVYYRFLKKAFQFLSKRRNINYI